ncbi:MAG: WD40 repeat domain-containing protein [Saprospiraceae bacterium]
MISIQKVAQLTGHESGIYWLGEGHSAHHFLSVAGDGWLVEWDLRNPDLGKLLAKVETQAFSALLLKKEERAVVGNMNGGVHWIDLREPDNARNILHHHKGVFSIQQIGNQILTAGGKGKLTRWSMEGKAIESFQLSNKSLRSIAFFAERNEVAVGASDGNIYLLNATSFELKKTLEKAHDNSVFSLKYSPDGNYLLSGGRDAHLNVWETENDFQQHSSRPAHLFTVNDICYSPNGKYFATASRDKTLKIWDAHTFELIKVIEMIRDKGHLNSVNAVYWSAYNNYLLSASDDRSIIIWEIK